MKNIVGVMGLLFLLPLSIQAQSFVSGSTGADGALNVTAGGFTIIQLPESGVLNYTTVNIAANTYVRFRRNSRNTPVIMLAQGNVIIAGIIDVSAGSDPDPIGTNRTPGPGGFYGGNIGQPGFGPGGGQPTTGNDFGRWVGHLSLVPIIGGSGGGGSNGCAGGGGGGAIVIASSTTISLGGSGAYINASGGGSPCSSTNRGSGGAIRLVANNINIWGALYAYSGANNPGAIRLEAPTGALTFTGTADPPAVLSTINPTIIPGNQTNLNIVSIGGYPVPPFSGQRFDTADVLLPNQLSDPISVIVQASNIPVGTQVNITFSGSPGATFTPGTLQGTDSSSTATLTISNITRNQVTYLFVSATFDLPANLRPKGTSASGTEQVSKVRIESAPGKKPKYVFLARDGKEINSKNVSKEVLQYFGQ